jgi:hypothetical protein
LVLAGADNTTTTSEKRSVTIEDLTQLVAIVALHQFIGFNDVPTAHERRIDRSKRGRQDPTKGITPSDVSLQLVTLNLFPCWSRFLMMTT